MTFIRFLLCYYFGRILNWLVLWPYTNTLRTTVCESLNSACYRLLYQIYHCYCNFQIKVDCLLDHIHMLKWFNTNSQLICARHVYVLYMYGQCRRFQQLSLIYLTIYYVSIYFEKERVVGSIYIHLLCISKTKSLKTWTIRP